MLTWVTRALLEFSRRLDDPFPQCSWPAGRTGAALVIASLVMGCFAMSPSVAWAVDTFFLTDPKGVKSWLEFLINTLTGTPAKLVASVGMMAVLYGIVVRAQRGEPIQGLATIAAAFILLVNVKDILQFAGYYYALPASPNSNAEAMLGLLL